MNILDENIPEGQCRILRRGRIRFRQVGVNTGRKGMKDREVISHLHQQDRPTFFTLDRDFYKRELCHDGYCLIYLDIPAHSVAEFIRRLLRSPQLNSKSKRMGLVVRVLPTGMTIWEVRSKQERSILWR